MTRQQNILKTLATLALLTLLIINVSSQHITVIDNVTDEPLELATLMCVDLNTATVTNIDGQADISEFAGSKTIIVRRLGYKTLTTSYEDLKKSEYLLSLPHTSVQFDEIVVSATRWNQPLHKTPSRVAIISSRDVAIMNPQTTADLLTSSGEIFIQKSQQGGGSPMIRGFATNRLLYTIDGVRMNSAIFRSGNLQNVISLDANAIERTEVVFGPGSTLYGSDAIGGVMNFQTLSPHLSLQEKRELTGRVMSRYGAANNEFTNHAQLSAGWKKWASVTSFTHSRFGDLKMGKNGPDEYLRTFLVQTSNGTDQKIANAQPLMQLPTGYSQTNLMQKVRYRPSSEWDFQYGLHTSEISGFSRYDRLLETQPDGLPVSAVWNYGPQRWRMNNLSVYHSGNNFFYNQLMIRMAHQYFEESRIDRKFNHHRLRTQLEKVNAWSANIDFEKGNNIHDWFYGIEYIFNDVVSKGSAVDIRNGNPIASPNRYPASEWKSKAVYLNYQYSHSRNLLIQTGIRYNTYSISSDFSRHLDFFPFDFTDSHIHNAASTGSIGVVYAPDETWKISANAGTAFRAPNVDDIGKVFDFNHGEVIVPNTRLQAEYAYNGEISISKLVGNLLKLDATAFYTYLDRAMVRRPFQVNGNDSILYNEQLSKVYAIQNAAFGTVAGFNMGIEIKLPVGLSVSSRYNFQQGIEEMDNGTISPSRHAAPAFGVIRLNYQQEKLTLQLYANYNAEVSHSKLNEEERQKPAIYAIDYEGNPYSPAWYTLNIKTSYQATSFVTINAGIENITDQRYRPYSSGLVAPGRNFIISVQGRL
jgi:hemoglobin/transferrin/lactoferrin receptor protein